MSAGLESPENIAFVIGAGAGALFTYTWYRIKEIFK
jgi:hypothetical protein